MTTPAINSAKIPLRPLRALLAEDNSLDAELVEHELREAGYLLQHDVVSELSAFARKIRDHPYDVILSDYNLCGWSGLDALEELKRNGLDVPFILVTGTLGDEKAVECMKLGASDYVLKDRLSRLPLAIGRALEAREREEQKKRIAEELWASESKLKMILSQLPAIIWTTDRDLRMTSLTGAGLAALPESHRQPRWLPLHPAEEPANPSIVAHRRTLAGESVEFESEFDGRIYWNRVEPLRDLAATVTGCLGLALDITEKKRSEAEAILRARELRQANQTLEALIASAPAAIIALDHSEHVRIWNPAAGRMFGWTAAEVLDRELPNVPPEREEEHRVFCELIRQGGSVAGIETQRKRKDGALIDVSLSAASLKNGGASPDTSRELMLIAVLTDITGRKQIEDERLRLITALEQSAEAVMIADTEGFIRYVNPAFSAITGYSKEEAIGQRTSLLKSGRQDDAFYAKLWKTILSGHTWRGEFENRRKNGSIVSMEASITPVRGPRGGITSFSCIQQDITERRALEHQLLQAQKFEAIGQLAGGIAHDFNNVLAAILGMAELGKVEAPEGTRIRERLEKICHHAGRAVTLTRQLLAFSRRQQLERRDINLNHSVSEVTSLVADSLGTDIEMKTEAAPDLASIHVDPSQIEQILMNLCVNARDAMPHGGRLTIATANVHLDEDECRRRPGIAPGEFVCLSVTDTGTGMDAATQERIFEPFFTTKTPGRGTGLGLATVYGVVKQHGGCIDVTSAPGAGTTFQIYFPTSVPAEQRPAPASDAQPVRGGKETILLAEDHEGLRELVHESLAALGYTVLAARDGEEAIELFQQHPGEVDLLVLDVVMPRLRGPDAYKRICALDAGIPVLFCTGYNPESAQVDTLAGHPVLQKPYPARELARTVRELLDQRLCRES
jgi:PAS domain S-box-containing protein